jgi:excisionase family DNA binding protein
MEGTIMDELLDLLTSEEVLLGLKISRSKLDQLIASGRLQALRVGEGGSLRFRRADVRAVLQPRVAPMRGSLPGRSVMKYG